MDHISLQDFYKMSKADMLEYFPTALGFKETSGKGLCIELSNKDILCCEHFNGAAFGYKFIDLIVIRHLGYIPPAHHENKDEYSYTTIDKIFLDPSDNKKVIDKFIKYVNGKTGNENKYKLKSLTDKEIDKLRLEQNKPL